MMDRIALITDTAFVNLLSLYPGKASAGSSTQGGSRKAVVNMIFFWFTSQLHTKNQKVSW